MEMWQIALTQPPDNKHVYYRETEAYDRRETGKDKNIISLKVLLQLVLKYVKHFDSKHQQKILCGQTDESKCLALRHILETILKVLPEKFSFLCFFLNLIKVHLSLKFTCNLPR